MWTISQNHQIKVDKAVKEAVKKVEAMNIKLGSQFPTPASVNQEYEAIDNNYWTTSFFTGLQFLCYLETEDQAFGDKISEHIKSFRKRLETNVELDTHDLGFLYEYSAMMAYKWMGNKEAREDALRAADLLLERYHEKAGIIQAWGDLDKHEYRGRMIIDANMNLPLLYWASHETGDHKYFDAAYRHVQQARDYIIRDDYSTYHTYYFSPETGEALKGDTQQGYSDDSCWARGQAWAIYGFALSYDYTKDLSLLKSSMTSADYFIAHLPKDKVCYWDLIFTDGDDQERDSSSAAIAACGLLELADLIKRIYPKESKKYFDLAVEMMISLIDHYAVTDDQADGLILHSVYAKPHNKGVDECSTWGDYYYLEALLRLTGKYKAII